MTWLGKHLARAVVVKVKDLDTWTLGAPQRARDRALELLLHAKRVPQAAHEENFLVLFEKPREVKCHRRLSELVFGRDRFLEKHRGDFLDVGLVADAIDGVWIGQRVAGRVIAIRIAINQVRR